MKLLEMLNSQFYTQDDLFWREGRLSMVCDGRDWQSQGYHFN